MSTFVFNIAKGRVAELYNRVKTNDPSSSALVVVAINANGVSDATMVDLDTLSAVLATAVNEVTNSNYARKVLTDSDLASMSADNPNDRMPLDFADQTWSNVGAGDAWTDLLVCYDANTGSGTDADIVPLTCHDFAITPSGVDVIATVNDFYRAA